MKKIIVGMAMALFLVVSASPASARQHFSAHGYTLVNPVDSNEDQQVVVYINQNDLSPHKYQAVFNYDTDQGPCRAAQVYITHVWLKWRQDSADSWQTISTITPQSWYGTSGDTCPGSDQFVSSPFVEEPALNGCFQAEATFTEDWGQPHNNTSNHTKTSYIFDIGC